MKYEIFKIIIVFSILTSCKKPIDSESNNILMTYEGEWDLVEMSYTNEEESVPEYYYDKGDVTIITKPHSGDIDNMIWRISTDTLEREVIMDFHYGNFSSLETDDKYCEVYFNLDQHVDAFGGIFNGFDAFYHKQDTIRFELRSYANVLLVRK